MGEFTLAGTVFSRSNRKESNPSIAREAYRKSTENVKSPVEPCGRNDWHVQGDGIMV